MVTITAVKQEHTLYRILRNILKDKDCDINIIGLDDPNDRLYLNESLYEKPFFLYIEEPKCFNHTHLFQNKNFKGFISHLKIACDELKSKFDVPTYYIELSSEDKDYDKINIHIQSLNTGRPINFISWGSWVDYNDRNFSNRGGNAVDNLICDLFKTIDGHLTFRTSNNLRCKSVYYEKINLIPNYMDEQYMNDLCYNSDIFLLPAKQVHSVSLTYAMSFGLFLIVSDGWGFSEYCDSLNSINYKNIDEIIEICSNREKLIEKRKNSLEKFKLKYTTDLHSKRISAIIDMLDHDK